MKMDRQDITRRLISQDFIHENISLLFPDSVFLDTSFRILGLSMNIQQSIGFAYDEVIGKSISFIDEGSNLEVFLKEKLRAGFFTGHEANIKKRGGGSLSYSISGLYLGLITDFNSVIVLRFVNNEQVKELGSEVQKSKVQVDNFIYRTAHDLRGPLATIMGLVNLLKMRTDDSEVDRFIHLINSHAHIMDEKLSRLAYLTESQSDEEVPLFSVDFSVVETYLRGVIEQNAFVDFLDFIVSAPVQAVNGYHEFHLQEMLSDFILYILSLPHADSNTRIHICVNQQPTSLHFVIKSDGFFTDQAIQQSIDEAGQNMYTDLLQHARLTNFFAAQKAAKKLRAIVNVNFPANDSQEILISIPKSVMN